MSKQPVLSFTDLVKLPPMAQFVLVLVLTLVVLFSCIFWTENPETYFDISTTGVGFYLWLNTFLLFFSKKKLLSYLLVSVIGFALLTVILNYTADYLSPIVLAESFVYKSLIAATSIFYGVALVVTVFAKTLGATFGLTMGRPDEGGKKEE